MSPARRSDGRIPAKPGVLREYRELGRTVNQGSGHA